jgi:hypothetical protein
MLPDAGPATGITARLRLLATSGEELSQQKGGAWRVTHYRSVIAQSFFSFLLLVMSKQALLDMWAAVHTREAAEAARADLNIVPPSLMDDALVSMRCRVCLHPHVAAADRCLLCSTRSPQILGHTYTHWHAHVSSGVSSIKNSWLPQTEWTSVASRCSISTLNLQNNFLPMISPATLQPLTHSLVSVLLDHNPIACLPLNLRACTALTLLSCCHARLAYVPALPPRLVSLRLHDNRLLQVAYSTLSKLNGIKLLTLFRRRCRMTYPSSHF